MHTQRIILGTALLILTGCQTIGGESMPTLTRTGEVKDVIIRENVDPASVTVNAGDEIRWINKRQAAVRVIFLTPMTENLACQRNFGGVLGFGTKRNQYTAKLRPNKTASICFRESGEVKYVVRAESTDFIGEQNLAGVISVGAEDQALRAASLADELAVSQRQVAERDASLASLQSQLDHSLAAQADRDHALSSISSQLAAAHTDRQRLADELAVSQRQLAERDAGLVSLRSLFDHNSAAQAERDQAASDIRSQLAAAHTDRQRLADELAVAQRQLTGRDASLVSLRSLFNHSNAAQAERDQATSDIRSELAAALTDRQRLADELAVIQGQLADRDAGLAGLRKQLDEHKNKAAEKDILHALQREISKGTVVIQQSDDALTINLASSLLFDSGQDRMKAGATDALKRVGTVLKDFPEKQVHVAGYTDNRAVKGGRQKKFHSNKELSDARANRAAQALRDGGMTANLWADGYGDTNPIASNATADGRAKNRRVEITITS